MKADSSQPAVKRLHTDELQRMAEAEQEALNALPPGTKQILDLYSNRVTMSMDTLLGKMGDKFEPRFKQIETGAEELEKRVAKLEKQVLDGASSAGDNSASSGGDWKPSNIIVKLCDFQEKGDHKIGMAQLRTWYATVRGHLGASAQELGELKVKTTENIYKFELPVQPGSVETMKNHLQEITITHNLFLTSAKGQGAEVWPTFRAKQHPVRMMRCRAFGALTETIREQATATGYLVTEDWKRSLSVSVKKADGDPYRIAGIDSSAQVFWDDSRLAEIGWNKDQLILSMRK
ncbi:unnamed protein product [Prorocentrum cordatum]|uniref:Uncharacterized protein n=1 Tax=Prorocentrum cordatum TaxID=2364126 RepID=A0ABN9UBN4_9DINO|nr:unnamed protein product [Polarella glacialis]